MISPSKTKMRIFVTILLILALCAIKGRGQRGYVGVQRGKLADASFKNVMAKLSSYPHQPAVWKQLLHAHPLALKYFLVTGPPGIQKEGSAYTSENLSTYSAGLEATINVSIAQYESSFVLARTGRITVKSWVLMFDCLDTECGSIAPVVLIKDKKRKLYQYSTVWQHLGSSKIITNAAPAALAVKAPELSMSKLNLHAFNLSTCSNDEVALQVIRSAIEVSLGVNPLSCYQLFSNILISDSNLLLTSSSKQMIVLLSNVAISRPLVECSRAPILLQPIPSLGTFLACVTSKFVSSHVCSKFSYHLDDITSGIGQDVSFLDVVVFNLNLAHGYASNKRKSLSLVSKTKESMSNISILDLVHTEGWQARQTHLYESHDQILRELCLLKLDQSTYDACSHYTEASCQINMAGTCELQAQLEQFTATYADEHSVLFNIDKGPVPRSTQWIWILSTIVTIALASLNALHNMPIAVTKLQRRVSGKLPIYLLLGLLDLVCIATVTLPVIHLIKAEIARQSCYQTWAFVTADMVLSLHGKKLPTLLVFSGNSTYASKTFLFAICIIVILTAVVFISTMVSVNSALSKLDEGDDLCERMETHKERRKPM